MIKITIEKRRDEGYIIAFEMPDGKAFGAATLDKDKVIPYIKRSLDHIEEDDILSCLNTSK